jgi:hypothetical protein
MDGEPKDEPKILIQTYAGTARANWSNRRNLLLTGHDEWHWAAFFLTTRGRHNSG